MMEWHPPMETRDWYPPSETMVTHPQSGVLLPPARAPVPWSIWFDAPPAPSQLLSLYVVPFALLFPVDWRGSVGAAPLVNPDATFVMTIGWRPHTAHKATEDRDREDAWSMAGTITVDTSGKSAFISCPPVAGQQAAGLRKPLIVMSGDQLRITAPAHADRSIRGYAASLLGEPLLP